MSQRLGSLGLVWGTFARGRSDTGQVGIARLGRDGLEGDEAWPCGARRRPRGWSGGARRIATRGRRWRDWLVGDAASPYRAFEGWGRRGCYQRGRGGLLDDVNGATAGDQGPNRENRQAHAPLTPRRARICLEPGGCGVVAASSEELPLLSAVDGPLKLRFRAPATSPRSPPAGKGTPPTAVGGVALRSRPSGPLSLAQSAANAASTSQRRLTVTVLFASPL